MQEYIKTDQKVHWLSQILAKANRAYVPSKEDDSHTNFYFEPLTGKLYSRWIEQDNQKFILALKPGSLQFEWLNRRFEVIQSISAMGKRLDEIEYEIATFPGSLGLPSAKIHEALHFDIPEYGFDVLHQKDISDEGLRQWKFFRHLANLSSLYFLGFLQAESEIRIWPHHFDTGVYAQLNSGPGLGFGLAMKDSVAGQPYFYLAGYDSGGQIHFKNLPRTETGRWITGGGWNGAILQLGDLDAKKLKRNLSGIAEFIHSTSNWYLSHIL